MNEPGSAENVRSAAAPWAFAVGCVMVSLGVVAHLPMFAMARDMGYRLAGMPMDDAMLWGMAAIVSGIALTAYGLLPPPTRIEIAAHDAEIDRDVPLGPAHWGVLLALVTALVIDVMKPASLGFTLPGMTAEYGVSRTKIALLPLSAITGTVLGSVLWGLLADRYGRRAIILLSAVIFVGTAICGAMPSFAWNVAMCFVMGSAAGGMLPVTYALLAEIMPDRHRAWSIVLVGGLGTVGGYFAASGLSAWLEPIFGWRALWLANLPTGLLLVALCRIIPESPQFLIAHGREEEARAVARRFAGPTAAPRRLSAPTTTPQTASSRLLGALCLCGFAWGLVNFGILLWLPSELVARDYSVGVASELLAKSALIALPTIFVAAWLYARWTAEIALGLAIITTLVGLAVLAGSLSADGNPLLPIVLLIVGANALIAILLPYATRATGLRSRAQSTGWVAAATKAGGLVAQLVAFSGLSFVLRDVALATFALLTIALLLVWRWTGAARS